MIGGVAEYLELSVSKIRLRLVAQLSPHTKTGISKAHCETSDMISSTEKKAPPSTHTLPN